MTNKSNILTQNLQDPVETQILKKKGCGKEANVKSSGNRKGFVTTI